MLVLGINAYHGDSSACLLRDGKLVAAAEEERFTRVKHWAGFPAQSVRYCLDEAGITLSQVDHIAINRDPKANFLKKVGFAIKHRPDFSLILERLKNAKHWGSIGNDFARACVGEAVNAKIHHIEHHAAHLSSAFHVSPFDEAVVVSVDGMGDFSSAAWGVGRGAGIEVGGNVHYPHSLGLFYMAITQYLGFPHYGDEYKVMGLAPYGAPSFMNEMRQLVRLLEDGSYRLNIEYFRHHRERIRYEWVGGVPSAGDLFTPRLEELLGPRRGTQEELTGRFRDIARSAQAMYEDAYFHLLNTLHRKYRVDHLALAGGCAMNSAANGKIYRNTPFRKAYIQPAAGDAGGALGAAYTVWHSLGGRRDFVMEHAYWGPAFDQGAIGLLLESKKDELAALGCEICCIGQEDELCKRTARALSEGKVVGWFQGRMEWGARALGNRSILGDPRRPDMKDILNLKIKRRESFRPFAPSIIREAVADWFEEDHDVPFMMQAFRIREEKRSAIPAVTHVDGSGRLQTVTRNTNPLYYKLIREFAEITGVPVLLNTSFNENEPVVCHPREALECFLRTKMDVLVIGEYLVERRAA